MPNDEMSGLEEVKSNFIKWGKIGDYVKGTLTDRRQVLDQLKQAEHPGAMQWLYELLVHAGSYHNINEDKSIAENPTVLEEGSFITVSGKPAIDNSMRNVKLGQIVGFRFTETKPPKQKGFNPNKVVKVYAGGMDKNWSGQDSTDAVAEVFPGSEEVK